MEEGILSSCTSLIQCEEVLLKMIEPGELLGKIPLSKTDWERLGTAFKNLIATYGENDGTNKLWFKFPTCAAVYLVYAGIILDRSGELAKHLRKY